MFVKKFWNTQAKKRYQQYQPVQPYRYPESGQTRHHVLVNLSKLPRRVIEAIDQSLKQGKAVVCATLSGIKVTTGDGLCEAGL
jgi:hypothetical protein